MKKLNRKSKVLLCATALALVSMLSGNASENVALPLVENGLADSIVISAVATEVQEYEGMQYKIVDGEIFITGYSGSATEFVIPAKIDGYPVVCINKNAFYGSTIEKVTVPNTLKKVETDYRKEDADSKYYYHGPFAGSSLKDVVFAEGTLEIADYILAGCWNVTSVVIPEGVTVIGKDAFMCCGGLVEVKLPASLESIDEEAFYKCVGIQKIELPEATKNLGTSAFEDCTALAEVKLNSVETIGLKCFVNTAITEVTLPKTLSETKDSYYQDTDVGYYNHGPFAGYNLKKAVFEDDTETVAAYVLSGCRNLEEVNLPQSVTVISEAAFLHCSKLTTIDLPILLQTIGEKAFSRCVGIQKIELPGATTSLGNSAFEDCTALSEVKLNSVETIGLKCFVNTAISEITLPKTLSETKDSYYQDTDVGYYNHGPFAGYNLKKAVFEDGTEIVSAHVLSGCRNLEEVVLPNTVTTVDEAAFLHCSALPVIHLPESVEIIAENAFVSCTEIHYIRLYESIKSVAENSFDGLYILEKEDASVVIDMIDDEVSYRAIRAGIKDNTDRLLDRENTYYRAVDALSDNADGVTFEVKYSFKTAVSEKITQTELRIKIPSDCTYNTLTLMVNGEEWTDYTVNKGIMTIKKVPAAGVVTFKAVLADSACFASYVQISGKYDKTAVTETIGIINPLNDADPYEIRITDLTSGLAVFQADFIKVSANTTTDFLPASTNGDGIVNEAGDALAETVTVATGMRITRHLEDVETDYKVIVVPADVDGDGVIAASDARLALRASVGLETLSEEQVLAADVNNDGEVTSADARLILRASVGLEEL